MGKPCSLDLRERNCAYVAMGHPARSAGRLFGVSAATAVRFAAKHRDHGTAAPKPQERPAGKFGKLAPHRNFLLDIVRAEPDITLKELAAALSDTHVGHTWRRCSAFLAAPRPRTRGTVI